MSDVSIKLTKKMGATLDSLVKSGVGSSRASVLRKAIEQMAEDEAVNAVLRAEKEPPIRGDLRTILKKMHHRRR